MTQITLSTGELDTNNNLDGWIIISETASCVSEPSFYVPQDVLDDLAVYMVRGDRIDINGNVYHNNICIANIAN